MSRISEPHFLPQLTSLSASSSSDQLSFDSLQAQLFTEATHSTSLLAMTSGGIAYRLARASLLPLFSSLPQMMSTALSSTLALGIEVGTFRAVHHGLSSTGEEYWNLRAWGSQCLDFGGLKSAGALFKFQSPVLRHAIQSLAMMAGEEAGAVAGLREKNHASFAERFAHASALNLALGAGTLWAFRLTGGTLQRVEGNLERRASAVQAQERVADSTAPRMASTPPAAAINEMVYAKMVRQDVLHQLSVMVGSDLMRRAAFMESRGGMESFAGEVVNLYFNPGSLTFSSMPPISFSTDHIVLKFQVPESGSGLNMLTSTRLELEKHARCASSRQAREFYKNMLSLGGLENFEWSLPQLRSLREHVANLEASMPELGEVENIARDFIPLFWRAESPEISPDALTELAVEVGRLARHKVYAPFLAYLEAVCRSKNLRINYGEVFQRGDADFYSSLRRLYLHPPFCEFPGAGHDASDPWLFEATELAGLSGIAGEDTNYQLQRAGILIMNGAHRLAADLLEGLVERVRMLNNGSLLYCLGQRFVELGQVRRGLDLMAQSLENTEESSHIARVGSSLVWYGESKRLENVLNTHRRNWQKRAFTKAALLYQEGLIGKRAEAIASLREVNNGVETVPVYLTGLGDREAALDYIASQVGPTASLDSVLGRAYHALGTEMDFSLRIKLVSPQARPLPAGYSPLLRRVGKVGNIALLRTHLTALFEGRVVTEVETALKILAEFPDPIFRSWAIRSLGRSDQINRNGIAYLSHIKHPDSIAALLPYVQRPQEFWMDELRQVQAIDAAYSLACLGEVEHSKVLFQYALQHGVIPDNTHHLMHNLLRLGEVRLAWLMGRHS